MKLVRRTFQVVPLDERVIDGALSTVSADFEDAIQAAAAVRVAADYVVTRNVADFSSLAVSAVTAEELLALMQP